MDITEFLTARLDEDEKAAAAAGEGPLGRWEIGPAAPGDSGGLQAAWVSSAEGWMIAEVGSERVFAEHIVRHDPARVLTDIAAKRRTLERHRECGSGHGYCDAPEDYTGPGNAYLVELGRCADLCDAAAPYADRPDYNPDWAADQST